MINPECPPYDAMVIGAGAGGLSAAARLVAAGRRTLLIEGLNRLGGRAASESIEGFTVNLGAIAIEKGSTFEETFNLVGVPLDIREPSPATVFSIDGKIVNVAKGGWGMLLGGLTRQAAKIGAKFADARAGDLPEAKLSTKEWLSKYTKNPTVHGLFRNLCAAIFAANADELPARAFLVYFAQKGAFKRFGFCPRGTMGLWNDLGDGIRRHGGEIWLETRAKGLRIEGGQVTAVEVERGGETLVVPTRSVICNMGPRASLELDGIEAFGPAYARQARDLPRPAANIVINFATREPIVDVPGLVTFSSTRRLCNIAEMTAMCPEMAPPGWHLHVAYAVPIPALGDFDEKAEIEASLQELCEQFPGFAQARLLSIRVMRDGWPAQRSCAGYDLPQETPIPNFWHVGDAVKSYGDGGTQACAETGKIAAALAGHWLDGAAVRSRAAL
ncbi:NAD(P)/FAD-dependent oxidoreductase [Oleomonas cavernae]|uniref:NAD(P)/FAD-dependent oxidoreductase n=1 Tax=Oleomonas cavernae TaxID=2320859 RepID=A0A418W907_9PROT|nr:FAD-dependent oxidoreductase [Oleomonas cavernae]RJF86478.1 NAD(P)/FAD-dependent oxidoreductase [Oleomonas cavernae]